MNQPTGIKKTEQVAAILLLCVIVIVGIIYLLIIPQIKSLKVNNLNVAVKQLEAKEKEAKVENLKSLESEIKAKKSTVDMLAIALPKNPRVDEILVEIEAIAGKSGLAILSISPSSQVIQEQISSEAGQTEGSEEDLALPAGEYQFTLSVEGTYPAIMAFIRAVESNLRPIKISAADFTGGDGSSPVLAASFELITYYQK